MRFLVWIGISLWISMPAMATTLVARSGEHDGFTRLVLNMPVGTQWSLDSTGRDVSVRVDLPDVTIDTSQVFSRIDRSRVAALVQSAPGTPLELKLGCDCEVFGSVQSGTLLVIDVSDPSVAPPPKPVFGSIPLQVPYRFQFFSDHRAETAGATIKLPARRPLVSASKKSGKSAQSLAGTNDAQLVVTDVNISEQRLLEQISRATNQGLLVQAPESETSHSQHLETEPNFYSDTGRSPNSDLSNLIATTVVDRDMDTSSEALIPAENGRGCIGSELIAVSEWGDDQSFGTQVSMLRSNLVEEFDTVNPEVALNLAQTYLYFGFGAEAKRILAMRQTTGPHDDILVALADIVDHEKPGSQNPFVQQQGCEGDVALWSLLSENHVSETANLTAMQKAFARLPAHLRVYLGPTVSRIFSEADESESAEVILRAVNRAGPETDSAYQLAEAAATRLRGTAQDATDQLLEVVNHGSEHSPQAVIDLIDVQLEERDGVSPDLPDLIAAYASEYRKSDLGSGLRRAHVIALALAGKHLEAFDALAEMADVDDPLIQSETQHPALSLLTENADDVIFMQIVLEQLSGNLDFIQAPLADKIAGRMLGMGFANEAVQLLYARDNEEPTETRRLLRAKAALAQNLPHRAMIELLGLVGEEADRLRAGAQWQIKDYQRAANHLLAVQEINGATRGFWLSDQWDAMPDTNETHYGQIVNVARKIDTDQVELAASTPLAEARALVETSQTTRRNISDLRSFVKVGQSDD